jgi:Secretion system C-terminal sorting domain
MNKYVVYYVLTLFLLSFCKVNAQKTEAEYLQIEQKRLEQAQKIEKEIEEFIRVNLDSYELSEETKEQISTSKSCIGKVPFSKEIKEIVSREELQNLFHDRKKQDLRELFFQENKEKEVFFQATPLDRTITCANGGFESGTAGYTFRTMNSAANWNGINTVMGGTPVTTVPLNQFAATTYVSLVSTGNDPLLAGNGIPVPRVLNGTRAIKLNPTEITQSVNPNQDYDITTMTRAITIDDNFMDINFSLIMNNPSGHSGPNFFRVRVLNAQGNVVDQIFITSNPQNCLFQSTTIQNSAGTNQTILYTGWVCARLNVGQILNQQATIEFMIADCSLGGHFSTVYIDDICGALSNCDNPQFGSINLDPLNQNCPRLPINVCGTYQLPPNSTLGTMSLNIVQGNTIVGTITNPTLTGSTFCFQVNAANFPSLTGQYEFSVSATFNINCPVVAFPFTISDTSTNIGPDIDFSIPITTPTFTQVAPICSGGIVAPLPTTSNNGITGSWLPALDNTATTLYTFTPNNPSQCATTTTMTITVNPFIALEFTPVAPICSGAPLAPLPTTSNNGITGSWSPSLDNMVTTTYTFQPTTVGCYSNTQLTIVVEDCISDCLTATLLTTEPHNTYVYNVATTIETSGNYVVNPGNNIQLLAGQHILLKPLTHVKAGSLFLAKIKGCGEIDFTTRDKFYFNTFCFNSSSSQTSTYSLFDEIIIGGVPANYQDFIITPTNLPAGVTINPNGTITIAAGLAINAYTFNFQVCEISNPSNCSAIGTGSFDVQGQITANPDAFSVILNGTSITSCNNSTLSVLSNDVLCPSALPVANSNVTVSLTSNPTGYFSLSGGTLVVATNTPAGVYTLSYMICLFGTSTCSSSTININVEKTIDAMNDHVTFNTQGILCCGNSSLTLESFENTTGPGALPSQDWNLGTGLWKVFDNGIGTVQRWGVNNTVSTPPTVYAGVNSAYINREQIGLGATSEDYLSTPLVTIPNNGKLHFFTRTFTNGNQGTIYQIKIAPSTANQTDPSSYTLFYQFTEDQLTFNSVTNSQNPFNVYTEHVLDLPAITGQVYIAFVKVYYQPTATISGDRWLVDNVRIIPGDEICDYNVVKNDTASNCENFQVVTKTNLYSQLVSGSVNISSFTVNPPTSSISLNTSTGDINVSPNAPIGVYTITYTICQAGVCDIATATVSVVDTCNLFIKENNHVNQGIHLNNIKLFPNPSKDIFNIYFDDEFKEGTVLLVYNMLGQKIIEAELSSLKEYQIDLSQYASGNYLVKINSDEEIFTSKIIKN